MLYGRDRWLAHLRRKTTMFQVAVIFGGSSWQTGKCNWAGDAIIMRPAQDMRM